MPKLKNLTSEKKYAAWQHKRLFKHLYRLSYEIVSKKRTEIKLAKTSLIVGLQRHSILGRTPMAIMPKPGRRVELQDSLRYFASYRTSSGPRRSAKRETYIFTFLDFRSCPPKRTRDICRNFNFRNNIPK